VVNEIRTHNVPKSEQIGISNWPQAHYFSLAIVNWKRLIQQTASVTRRDGLSSLKRMKQVDRKKVVGELALLRRIRERSGTGRGLRLGIGDDCALLRTRPNEELAVTTDLSIAGRHFQLNWHPPEAIGHRTLARGLSDLAAMGARPLAAFLSLGLPRELTAAKRRGSRTWVDRFFDGLLALADTNKTSLAGGDLAESPVAMADIVLVGAVPRGRALLRSGARPGHLLYVTGSLGGAAAGLDRLSALMGTETSNLRRPAKTPKSLEALLAPHLYPQPRIAQGLMLQRRGLATAALDLSDGLSTDLAHLCEESGVAAVIEVDSLPRHTAVSLDQALHGGEDYELLFTARKGTRIPRRLGGVAITQIGRITRSNPGEAAVQLNTGGVLQPLEPRGWQHFS
jgi:thiamine-monophosphate kinase